MAERPGSRLEPARRRALGAKQVLAWTSAVAFAAALVLARTSHPGTTSSSSGASSSSADSTATDEQTNDELEFGYDQGSLAPSTGFQPSAQSSVS